MGVVFVESSMPILALNIYKFFISFSRINISGSYWGEGFFYQGPGILVSEDRLQLFPPVRENYLLSVVSKYYVPYQSDGRIGLSAA